MDNVETKKLKSNSSKETQNTEHLLTGYHTYNSLIKMGVEVFKQNQFIHAELKNYKTEVAQEIKEQFASLPEQYKFLKSMDDYENKYQGVIREKNYLKNNVPFEKLFKLYNRLQSHAKVAVNHERGEQQERAIDSKSI